MKNIHENTILAVTAEIVAYTFLMIAALCAVVMSGSAISVSWTTLTALVLVGGVAVGALGYFFRSIEVKEQKVMAA